MQSVLPERDEHLEQFGRVYGELGLAVNFTDGIAGEDAKRCTARGWPKTAKLPDGDFGASYLRGRSGRRNPVVVLGASHLIGIDLDGAAGKELLLSLPVLFPPTVTVVSGRPDGGRHLWYRRPEGAPARLVKVQLTDRVTVAADGYLVCPPALHPSGRRYEFAAGLDPWTTEIAELPLETAETLDGADRGRSGRQRHFSGPISEGDRHEHLRQISWAMRRYSGASLEAITEALLTENRTRCTPPKREQLVVALSQYTFEHVLPIGDGDE